MAGKADDAAAAPLHPARAYSPGRRLAAASLRAVSRASLLLVLYLVLTVDEPPVTPPVLVRLMLVLFALPGLAAWLVRRASAVEVTFRGDTLLVARPGLGIEAPAAAIAAVRPWRVPLPEPGFGLVLQDGTALGHGIGADDPTPIVGALAGAGVASAGAALDHPSCVYAQARARHGPRGRWWHHAARYPVFGLFSTLVLFRAHQHIAYGGTFGQYYLLGLAAYLETFVAYWVTVTIYLLLYASVWRGLAEAACLAAAHATPAHAAVVRRVAEVACQVLYFGGVPVLLAARFLA